MTFGFRVAVAAMFTASLWAGSWSAPAEATDAAGNALVTCRAKLSGDHLVVEIRATQGWHVYAMDNQLRAKEALAGRMSLGVEQDTEVLVSGGLKVVGDWFQTMPEDFSQPELRWYSYGFEGTSTLAAEVERTVGGSATVTVRAQACDSASCVAVESELSVPLADTAEEPFSTDGLVPVRSS
ncbi:MAG: protein-disulfide reductase DsbD family protein [Bryobacterales bacterium]|nr:protein-disulfide reductase DsbD family protein [Bryobacterales bacterium]